MKSIKNFILGKGKKKIFEYIFFVVISFLFWMILTQSEMVQDDFEVPVLIENSPQDMIIKEGANNVVLVNLKGSGFGLLKYRIGKLKPIILDYNKYNRNKNVVVGKTEMSMLLRDYFGKGKTVISHTPDSLSFIYSSININDTIEHNN